MYCNLCIVMYVLYCMYCNACIVMYVCMYGMVWYGIGMYWYVLVCIGMYWYVLVCIGMYWYVLVCMYVYKYFLHIYIYIHIYTCIYIYIYIVVLHGYLMCMNLRQKTCSTRRTLQLAGLLRCHQLWRPTALASRHAAHERRLATGTWVMASWRCRIWDGGYPKMRTSGKLEKLCKALQSFENHTNNF